MYLGLANVCVDPAGRFGFHGPAGVGARLPDDAFEYWSQIMARNYREPLRSWFMTKARYSAGGVFELSGADLIGLGYRSCST